MGPGLLLLAACLAPGQTLVLADAGQSAYRIVLADDAPPPVVTAGRELAEYLRLVTGATLPVVRAAAATGAQPTVFVGDSPALRRAWPEAGLETLGPDGIVVQTVGSDLVLAGRPPRGTVYAVGEFLERVVGVRWWSAAERTVPATPHLTVPPQDQRYTPPLRYREVFYRDAFDGVFAAHLRSNGHFEQTTPEYGGHMSFIGFCHTFYQFLPPEQYFAAHPDWYSEHGGKRTADGGQLCCSSEGARQEMIKVALERIGREPNAGIISISQNDWAGWCECAACRQALAEDGSQAGPLLRFVNAVAEAVEQKYPDVLVETLAYQASRQPPKVTKPRKNVLVRLCSIECDFGHPLATGARNASFAADIRGWSKIAPQLFIWNYVTNFANYLIPQQNLTALAPDIRFFVANGTVGLFEQGDAGSTTGDFVRLRAWLLAHLEWDPKRDEGALLDEFLSGYYGAAAPHLRRYLELREQAQKAADVHFGCYRNDTGDWLPLSALTQLAASFDAAEQAVAGNAEQLKRVQRERLPLTLAWLQRDRALRAEAKRTGVPWAGPVDALHAAEAWRQACLDWQTGQYAEGRPFEPFGDAMVDRFRRGAPPEQCKDLPADSWTDWQDGALTLHGLGNWVTRVDDAAASDGKAARMPGTHTQWAVQCPLGELTGEKWHLYAVARVDTKATTGTALALGIYDTQAAAGVAGLNPKLEEAAGPGYHTFDLGSHVMGAGFYFWAAPMGKPDEVTAVYVDRVFAIKE